MSGSNTVREGVGRRVSKELKEYISDMKVGGGGGL